MTFTFIVNPTAGRRRFPVGSRTLEQAARSAGLDYRVEYTKHRGHAAELARSSALTSDAVVAVGGDGTIHEVVSGLVRAGCPAHFGVIPAGTGNDFAKMLDISRNLGEALRTMNVTDPRPIDYGRVSWEGPAGPGEGIFVNVAGAGIDAKVAAEAASFKMLGGTARYLAAVFRVLRSWESPRCRLEWTADDGSVTVLEGDVLLAVVGNGRCAAGGFYLTPRADITDARLDLCVVRSTSVGRILTLIPRVLRGGTHESEPEVETAQAARVTLTSETPLPVQADGEVLTDAATTVHFAVAAGELSLVQPVKR